MIEISDMPDYIKAYQQMLEAAAQPTKDAIADQKEAVQASAQQAAVDAGANLKLAQTRLPAQLANAGLLGTGEAESAVVALNAAYQTALGEIAGAREQSLNELNLAESQVDADVDAQVWEKMADVYLQQAQAEAEAQAKAQAAAAASSTKRSSSSKNTASQKEEAEETTDPFSQALYEQLDEIYFQKKDGGVKAAQQYLIDRGFTETQAAQMVNNRYSSLTGSQTSSETDKTDSEASKTDNDQKQDGGYYFSRPLHIPTVGDPIWDRAAERLNTAMDNLYGMYRNGQISESQYTRELKQLLMVVKEQ